VSVRCKIPIDVDSMLEEKAVLPGLLCCCYWVCCQWVSIGSVSRGLLSSTGVLWHGDCYCAGCVSICSKTDSIQAGLGSAGTGCYWGLGLGSTGTGAGLGGVESSESRSHHQDGGCLTEEAATAAEAAAAAAAGCGHTRLYIGKLRQIGYLQGAQPHLATLQDMFVLEHEKQSKDKERDIRNNKKRKREKKKKETTKV
jgi:streptolysin S family bacteriocin protoxin